MAKLRCVSLALAFLFWSVFSGCGYALDKIPDLAGTWSGPGLSIYIDPSRHQANADPTKPFNRQPFMIRNVTGPMVVFIIGPDLFIGQMTDPDTMVVTRGGLLESYTLSRRKAPAKGR